MNQQKLLNSVLIKELRKCKEENTKLKHENEILNGKIEKLETENKTLKSDFSMTSIKNENPHHEETMEIVENILQSNHEIKEEPLDYSDLIQKYSSFRYSVIYPILDYRMICFSTRPCSFFVFVNNACILRQNLFAKVFPKRTIEYHL